MIDFIMKKIILYFSLFIFISKNAFALVKELKGTSAISPPFVYFIDNNLVGADYENIKNVFERLGYLTSYKLQTWEKSLAEATDGKYDFIFVAEETESRRNLFYFSEPTFTVKTVFYKRKIDDVNIIDKFLLRQLKTGVTAGYKYERKIQNLIDSKSLNLYTIYGENGDLQGLLKTVFNQIDMYICVQLTCNYIIDNYKNKFPELHKLNSVDPKTGEFSYLRVAFPKVLKNSYLLREQFNTELEKYKKTALFHKVMEKYRIQGN
jgi:ABC-type amino acid transport substrate-binding protein